MSTAPASESGTQHPASANVRITLKLLALLTDYLPQPRRGHQVLLDVPSGTTIQDVVQRLRLPEKLVHLVLVDGVHVEPAQRARRVLREGETLAIWPPVAGG